MMCRSKMDDDDFEAVYSSEQQLPDFRLRDGLDLTALRLGEGQEFEVEIDDEQKGNVSLDLLWLLLKFLCFLWVVLYVNNVLGTKS